MSSQGGSLPLQCPCCKQCTNCTDLEKIIDVREAGLHELTIRGEHVNTKTNLGAFTADTHNIFILQNTKNDEINSMDFITEFEPYELRCPRCKKILQNAKNLLQKVPSLHKKQILGLCDHCRKKKSCKMCHGYDKIVKNIVITKRHREETEESVNTKLAKIPNFSKVCRHDERGNKSKYSVQSDAKYNKLNKATSDLEFERKIKQLLQTESIKYPTPISDMAHDISDIKLNSYKNKQEKIAFEKTGDLSEQYHRYLIAEDQISLDTLTRNREIRMSNTKIKESLLTEIDVSTKLVPTKAFQARKLNFILKSKEETLSSQDIKSDSEEYLYLKKGKNKLKSNLVHSQCVSASAIRENEIPTGKELVIREYHSEEALPASLTDVMEHELRLNFIYFFSQEPKSKETHQELKNSVELIKDTQDMLHVRTEDTKSKNDDEKNRRNEEKEKKRIARKGKKNFEKEKKIYVEVKKKKLAEEVNETRTVKSRPLQANEKKSERETVKVKPSEIKEGNEMMSRTTSEKGKESKTKEIHANKVLEKLRLEKEKDGKEKLQKNKDTLQAKEEKLIKKTENKQRKKEKEERFHIEKRAKIGEEEREKIGERTEADTNKPKQEKEVQTDRYKKEKETKREKSKIKNEAEADEVKEEKEAKTDKYKKDKVLETDESKKEVRVEKNKFHKEKEAGMDKFKKAEKAETYKSKKEKGLGEDVSIKMKEPEKYKSKEDKIVEIDTSKKIKVTGTNEAEGENKKSTKQNKLTETDKSAQEKFKQLLSQQVKQEEDEFKIKKQIEEEERKANEKADKLIKEGVDRKIIEDAIKRAKEGTDGKSMTPMMIKNEPQKSKEPTKKVEEPTLKELTIRQIKTFRKPSSDDLILQSVKLKQMGNSPRERQGRLSNFDLTPRILQAHKRHKHKIMFSDDSDLDFDVESFILKKEQNNTLDDKIVGPKIYKNKHLIELKAEENKVVPVLFKSTYEEKPITFQNKKMEEEIPVEVKLSARIILPPEKSGKTAESQEFPKGVIRYALSDRSFIEKGWTMLPTEKVVRKMNVYRMRPAHPEFDWFARNKNKRLMEYDTGEKLAEFDDNGRGRWYYRNGRLALNYYDAEEMNAQQRFVIYSSGEPDDRGRTHPVTVLATFDYLGNGIVFDHTGKLRLKYNQTEGVLLDRNIGPVSNWKWHTLNDPPVLQQVMIDTQMSHKDPRILKMGGSSDKKPKPDNEEMLTIEFDNFIKEKSKKLSQTFKPFQIKMKALKINEYFSLRVLDQATIYLLFRDGSTNLKLNIGMILDHKEIVDTDSAEVGEVSVSLEHLPARTDSLAALQRSVANAQHAARLRTEYERRLRRPEPSASADQLMAGASRPMRPPFRTVPSNTTVTAGECHCKSKKICP